MHFNCKPLKDSKRKKIEKLANMTCDDLMRFAAGDIIASPQDGMDTETCLAWEYWEDMGNTRIEKVRVPSTSRTSAPIYYFRGITQMEAKLEEVLELYESQTEETERKLQQKFEPDLISTSTLYDIKRDDLQFIAVRWAGYRPPYVLVRNRDYCYLECRRFFELSDGRRGFARCLHSVTIPSCPDLEKAYGYVRGSMYESGLVFVEKFRGAGYLKVIQAVSADFKGKIPQFVAVTSIRQRLLMLKHIKEYLYIKRVANQTFPNAAGMQPRRKAKTCFICVEPVGGFKRRYNCQKCGEVVCRKCKISVALDIPVVGSIKLTVCSFCSLASQHSHRLQRNSSAGADSSDAGIPEYNEGRCDEPNYRPRALSMNSFHTASLDQTTVCGSILSHDIITSNAFPSTRE